MDTVIYIHGRGGSAAEAEHYRPLFPSRAVTGLSYRGDTPWEAGREIRAAVLGSRADSGRVTLIANSVGAFFSMHAGIENSIDHAFFISPVVDMERLITDMMRRSAVTEAELRERGRIRTAFGEELSWEYLRYVREHPLCWAVPTDILYGSEDGLTDMDTIRAFARKHRARLTVMNGAEHWFHTEEQMRFLDRWILEHAGRPPRGGCSQPGRPDGAIMKQRG